MKTCLFVTTYAVMSLADSKFHTTQWCVICRKKDEHVSHDNDDELVSHGITKWFYYKIATYGVGE